MHVNSLSVTHTLSLSHTHTHTHVNSLIPTHTYIHTHKVHTDLKTLELVSFSVEFVTRISVHIP